MTLDELESDRSDRKCNALVPAFWWCVMVGCMVVWMVTR